jgi:hypothetical protein
LTPIGIAIAAARKEHDALVQDSASTGPAAEPKLNAGQDAAAQHARLCWCGQSDGSLSRSPSSTDAADGVICCGA